MSINLDGRDGVSVLTRDIEKLVKKRNGPSSYYKVFQYGTTKCETELQFKVSANLRLTSERLLTTGLGQRKITGIRLVCIVLLGREGGRMLS